MHDSSRPIRGNSYPESNIDDRPIPEYSYRDRLYIQFGQGMTFTQHLMFQNQTRERKDYLFDLWLKKNGYV